MTISFLYDSYNFKIFTFFFFFVPMESRYDSVGLSLSLASVTYDSTKFVVLGLGITMNGMQRCVTTDIRMVKVNAPLFRFHYCHIKSGVRHFQGSI